MNSPASTLVSTTCNARRSVAPFGDGGLDLLEGEGPSLEADGRRQLDRLPRGFRNREPALQDNDDLLGDRPVVDASPGAQPLVQLFGKVLDDERGHDVRRAGKLKGTEMVSQPRRGIKKRSGN